MTKDKPNTTILYKNMKVYRLMRAFQVFYHEITKKEWSQYHKEFNTTIQNFKTQLAHSSGRGNKISAQLTQ